MKRSVISFVLKQEAPCSVRWVVSLVTTERQLLDAHLRPKNVQKRGGNAEI